MKRHLFCIGFVAMLASIASSGYAWGPRGHYVVAHVAVRALPDDGPVFLKKYVDDIGSSAVVADWWRDLSYPFEFAQEEEAAKHGWPVERYAFLKQIPHSRTELALDLEHEYATRPDPVATIPRRRRADGLPYVASEAYGHLIAGFRVLRAARAAGRPTEFLESSCALYVAWLGHYIGDGAQPLHTTIHTQGWMGPNPNGYTLPIPARTMQNAYENIHSRFEGAYVDKIGLTDVDILPRVSPLSHQTGDVFQLVLDYLKESNGRVEAIYKIDKRHGLDDANDKEGKEVVYTSVAFGASMLRDLVYRAWLESALPMPPPFPAK